MKKPGAAPGLRDGSRRNGDPALILLTVDRAAQGRAGGELGNAGSGDLDGSPRLRVAAGAGGALGNFETAEAGEGDLLAGGQLFGNDVQHGGQGAVGLSTGNVEAVRQGFDKFTFVHGYSSWLAWVMRDLAGF